MISLFSDIDVNLPLTDGDPPIAWWNEDADKSLVIGVYKHGMVVLEFRLARMWTLDLQTTCDICRL